MANTTNYNWETPDDTDLVKDGAAAIRTLGSSIDTTTKALNPSTTLGDIEYRSATANTNARLAIGTTGQILSVVAGVPAWVANDVGDITEVAAGTGISGGGTSGSVTITNSMATAIDAKGDLIGGTGADTFARLAVGANDTVLTADSTAATGLKWAAPAGGSSFSGCSLYKSVAQSIGNATATAVTFDSENFDVNGYHSTSTNTSRITIPSGKAGYYLISGSLGFGGNTTGIRISYLYKNGSLLNLPATIPAVVANDVRVSFNYTVNLAVSDYIELFAYQNSGGSLNVSGDAVDTTFSISYLGA
jgi:hypothetical protein